MPPRNVPPPVMSPRAHGLPRPVSSLAYVTLAGLVIAGVSATLGATG